MSARKHILYISGIVPRQGTGGWIVMYRHLERLEKAGWRVSLVIPQQCVQSSHFPESWEVIVIPMRKWWWPPVKSYLPGSLTLRVSLWCLECERILKFKQPDVILTLLGDNYALLAKQLSRAWTIPLAVIVHDDLKLRATTPKERAAVERQNSLILSQAERVWLVSPEMKNVVPLNKASQVSVLCPIPHGNYQEFVEWRPEFQSNPTIAHAGSFYLFHVPYFLKLAAALEKVSGTLLIVASKNNPASIALLETCSNVKIQEPFEKNEDVLSFLKEQASCMVVFYPFGLEENPWTATSFPSRMIEFMHLGLPFLIFASPNTALGNWALKNNWQSYLKQFDDAYVSNFLRRLIQPNTWSLMAEQSRHVAMNEFNPDVIQAQFEAELKALTHSR
jgi:glycosyltransferase involved in cell wall biosynthesis